MDSDPIADFIEWYGDRPVITKTFITLSVLLAVLVGVTDLTYMQFYYAFGQCFQKLQLWRLWTSFLYLGHLHYSLVIKAYLAYLALFYSERDIFGREKLADYLMLVLFDGLLVLGVSSLYDLYFLGDSLLFALLYVQSHFKPFQEIGLVFGVNVPVKYFLWVYAGFNVLMSAPFINFVVGFVVGYLYVKIKTSLLQKFGMDFWPTPSLVKRVVKIYLDWADRRCRNPMEEGERQQFGDEGGEQQWS